MSGSFVEEGLVFAYRCLAPAMAGAVVHARCREAIELLESGVGQDCR